MSETPFDLLCIGYGPASLAISIALLEQLHPAAAPVPALVTPALGHAPAENAKLFSSLGGLQETLASTSPAGSVVSDVLSHSEAREGAKSLRKVCFIEKNDEFKWHSSMLLPGSKMQISFLKDLVTTRNPSSSYSFLSYLHSFNPSRLISFISLGIFSPTRREYSNYMQWAAKKAQAELESSGLGGICYREVVLAVDAVVEQPSAESGEAVKLLRVISKNTATGEEQTRWTKNLIISTGGAAKIPKVLQLYPTYAPLSSMPRVIHTSRYLELIEPVLREIIAEHAVAPTPQRTINVAVIGAGQSAAEVFLSVRSTLSSLLGVNASAANINLFIRRSTLRPADSSAFSNEIFDPGMSQLIYGLEEDRRESLMNEVRGTNYSVVNPVTLSEIYTSMYDQQVEEDINASEHKSPLLTVPRLSIHPFSEITHAKLGATQQAPTVLLTVQNSILNTYREEEFDLVICGTGYDRFGWKDLLFPTSSAVNPTSTSAHMPLTQLFSSRHAEVPYQPAPTSLASSIASLTLSSSTFPSPGSSAASSVSNSHSAAPPAASNKRESHTVNRVADLYSVMENYRLDLPKTFVGADAKAGAFLPTVWLQGCNEGTHGISDSLLSVLAVRSGEVASSILDEGQF